MNYAVSKTIQNLGEQTLPKLLQYYKDNCKLIKNSDLISRYNIQNNLPKKYDEILRGKILND